MTRKGRTVKNGLEWSEINQEISYKAAAIIQKKKML